MTELRAQWRQFCGTEPPRLSRDLLIRALAYRLQERAQGGLSRASIRRLAELAREAQDGTEPPHSTSPLRPGATLVREWRGRTHLVTVTQTGFEYAGSRYGSLTQIARLITGAHWSGPRFFGLRRHRSEPACPSERAEGVHG